MYTYVYAYVCICVVLEAGPGGCAHVMRPMSVRTCMCPCTHTHVYVCMFKHVRGVVARLIRSVLHVKVLTCMCVYAYACMHVRHCSSSFILLHHMYSVYLHMLCTISCTVCICICSALSHVQCVFTYVLYYLMYSVYCTCSPLSAHK